MNLPELDRHLYRWVTGAALLCASIGAFIWWDPRDTLGFRTLLIPVVFLVVFWVAWPLLAVSGLLIVRRIGMRIFRTVTLWIGLTMYIPVVYACAQFFVLAPARRRNETRQLSHLESTLATTGDITILSEPLSGNEDIALMNYADAHGRTLDQRLALVKRFPHSWGLLLGLASLPDAQPELLQSIYDVTLQSRAAVDVEHMPYISDVDAAGRAYSDTLSEVRAVWQNIASNPNVPPALLDVMARSPNPFQRRWADSARSRIGRHHDRAPLNDPLK